MIDQYGGYELMSLEDPGTSLGNVRMSFQNMRTVKT